MSVKQFAVVWGQFNKTALSLALCYKKSVDVQVRAANFSTLVFFHLFVYEYEINFIGSVWKKHARRNSMARNFEIGSSRKYFLTCYEFDRCHFRSSQQSIIKQNWRVEESLWKKPKVRDDLKKRQSSKPCYRDDLSNRSEVILSSINDTWSTFPRSINKKSQDNIHRTGRQYT